MDMNISSTPVSKFNWDGLVEKLKDVAPEANISGAEATHDTNGMNVTITIGEGEAARQVTVSVPDLEAPGVIDATEFSSLLSKLEAEGFMTLTDEAMAEVANAFNELAGTPLPKSTGNVLFDIYALMALMLDAMQSQRDAARSLRQAENMAIQTAIQHQAQSQRDAAWVGIIASLAVAAIQIAAQGVALGKSASGNKMQRTAMRESGVGQAQTRATAATDNVTTQSRVLQNKQTQIDAAEVNVREKTSARDAARTELEAKQQVVDNKTAAQQEAMQEFTAAQPKAREAAKQKLETANAELETATAERNAAQERLTQAEQDVNAAETVREDAVQQHADQQRVLNAAEQEVATTQTELSRAEHQLQNDIRYIKGRNQQDMWHNIGDMIGAVGNVMQSMVRSTTEMIQAEATEEGAEVKRSEENLDQTKDLFNQAQEVIRAMLSLFAAVIQAESQSMRDAIHA